MDEEKLDRLMALMRKHGCSALSTDLVDIKLFETPPKPVAEAFNELFAIEQEPVGADGLTAQQQLEMYGKQVDDL